MNIEGYCVGLTGTRYANNGMYINAQLQYIDTASDLSSNVFGDLGDGDIDGTSVSDSLEVGKRINLESRQRLSLALNLELNQQVTGTDENGLGSRRHLYGIASVVYELEGKQSRLRVNFSFNETPVAVSASFRA